MEARLYRGVALLAALFSLGASHRTANFVVTAPTPDMARQIGQMAEKYRRELAIERTGLTGRRVTSLRPGEVRSIRPVTSYAINGEPYFSIEAEVGEGPKASLGSSVKGADVASSLARRIARAAGIPESRVLAPRLDAAIAGQEA